MLENIKLVPLNVDIEDHLELMYRVRTHPDMEKYLRGLPPSNYEQHIHYLKNAGSKCFFLVQHGDHLIGYCQLTLADAHTEIGMALHPEFCGKGIGTAALNLLLKTVEASPHFNQNLILYVKSNNLRAIALYAKYGFVREEEINKYGEYLMKKKVTFSKK